MSTQVPCATWRRGAAVPAPPSRTVLTHLLDGQTATQHLIRPIDPIQIAETPANDLSALYNTSVTLSGSDTPVVVKIVGSPDCVAGHGRNAERYGAYHTDCSGCCPTTSSSAKMRKQGSVDGVDDKAYGPMTVELHPGDVLDLQLESAAVFGAISQVFLRFHRVTQNGIVDLYGSSWYASWTVRTRRCVLTTSTYPVSCSGPCGCRFDRTVDSTSSSTITRWTALQCSAAQDVLDGSQTRCDGPFEAWSDCTTDTNSASSQFRTVLYYNCQSRCTVTSCV